MEKIDQIYLINLDRREDRLEYFLKKFPYSKSNFQRFPAIDGQTLKITEEISKLFKNNNFNWLRGKIGCAYSHYLIWKNALLNNKKNIFILEDDIDFISNFKKIWKEIYLFLPQDFDIIPMNMEYYIEDFKVSGKRNRKDVFGDKIFDYNKGFYKVKGKIYEIGNFGTCGYLISTKGIQKLLEKAEKEGIRDEADNFINHSELEVYLPKKWMLTHNSLGGTDVTFHGDFPLE
jgi:GR25 family glycosyltransferase involved in LPS biosynthesis